MDYSGGFCDETKKMIIKSILLVIIAAIISIICLGLPEQNDQLVVKVNTYISELYKIVNGTEVDKASFLMNGFCFDGTLEQLALEANDAEHIVIVESLGRDCRIISGLLQS